MHHQLNEHKFEQAPGDAEGQGSLACCSPWDRKELDTTERLNRIFGIKIENRLSLNPVVGGVRTDKH